MIRFLRRLTPPRFLPVARGIYSLGRRVIKLAANWVVPPGLVRVMQRIDFELSLGPDVHESTILSRNAKFRNMYAGRRCFVIGNGPSLNKQDLAPLANEVTIAMNFFNKHPIIEKWKPTFFCMEEPVENIKRIGLSPFLDKIEAQAYFFHIGVKELFDEHQLLDVEKVYYFRVAGSLPGYPTGKNPLDLAKSIPAAWTTAQTAIMIALYMGCSPIYLIGLDHDWLADPNAFQHFYTTSAGDAEPAFLSDWGYKKLLEVTLHIWRTYELLRDVACKQGVTIYNATAGGFLDVFPRVEFESLFPARNK